MSVYNGTGYRKVFELGKYNEIFNSIRQLTGEESGITYVISHNFVKTKVDSYDSLPLEKTLSFHDVIILITLGFYKDKMLILENISY